MQARSVAQRRDRHILYRPGLSPNGVTDVYRPGLSLKGVTDTQATFFAQMTKAGEFFHPRESQLINYAKFSSR